MEDNKTQAIVDLDDEMRDICYKILKILPEDKVKGMAIIIFLKQKMAEVMGVTDEIIVEGGEIEDDT